MLPFCSLWRHGGEPGRQEKGKREPIVITSSRMEADKLGDKVTFTGM